MGLGTRNDFEQEIRTTSTQNSLRPCLNLFTVITTQPSISELASRINETNFGINVLTLLIYVPRLHWHCQIREMTLMETQASNCNDARCGIGLAWACTTIHKLMGGMEVMRKLTRCTRALLE
ncbi:hypothetical protein VTP01DRAFT_3519, partial [Rhizomucor pusillus]|uniref:uncharacterized protein n=1 Tax=Rhizomucor pusillus TaxID=4840 RepID=UPI00374228F5